MAEVRVRRSVITCCIWAFGLASSAQTPVVLLTDATDLASSVAQLDVIRARGMDVRVIAAPGAFIGTVGDWSHSAHALFTLGSVRFVGGSPDRDELPEGHRLAVDYLDALMAGRFESSSARGPMDWSAHPEDQLSRQGHEGSAHDAGDRDASTAPDWTCSRTYNSEYMAGTVCVSAFFVESNGTVDPNMYTWSAQAIADVKLQIIDAWSIWSYTASLYGNTVTAVMDYYDQASSIPDQPYEPVTRPSTQDNLWIGAIMQNAGFAGSDHYAQCDAFNAARRAVLATDRAYCAFIAYNPPAQSAPTQFTNGRTAYAYLGGPYTQFLYKTNGWGTDQINRVFGHETAHIFHAFDEYAASGTANCSRWFNGRQNSNFQGSSCSGTGACVMVNNTFTGSGATRQWDLCPHTPYHLGWVGRLMPPVLVQPLNDVVVTSQPVKLKWNRNGAPSTAYGYLKVFNRSTGDLVHCGFVGQQDSTTLSLVNGMYDWTISQGNTNDGNGYAGVISSIGQFTVNSPLAASFTFAPATICAGSPVAFTNTSTGAPTSWTWSFPGGQPSTHAGSSPPPIVYPSPGYYSVSLTVNDGVASQTMTVNNAITVTGGAVLPFQQDFNGGSFPPTGWTVTGGQGQGLFWTADAVAGCDAQTVTYVNAYAFQGQAGGPQIGTPRIDLTTATMPYLKFSYSYAQETSTNTETFQVYGHDCGFGVYSTFFNRTGAALATNGGGYVAGQPWVPSDCSHWRDVVLAVDPLSGRIGQFWFYVFSNGGQNLFLDKVSVFNGVRLPVRVLLQGPWDVGSQLMNDNLRTQGLIPAQEPYSAAGYVYFDEGGTHTVNPGVLAATGTNAIVDWAILELRDALVPTHIVCSRPVLVQRDGDVVDYDGSLAPRMAVPTGNYFVALKHRNHLGVMSAAPAAIANGMNPVDFSAPATLTWGTDARLISGGKALLWAGNTNGNTDVRYTGSGNDRDPVLTTVGSLTPNNSVSGYLRADCTMDGIVRYTGPSNDRDPILFNVGSTTPNNWRTQQIP